MRRHVLTEIAHIHDEVVRANDLYWQVLLQGTAAKSVTLNVIIAARPKGWVIEFVATATTRRRRAFWVKAAEVSCSISVFFKPSAVGKNQGTLNFSDASTVKSQQSSLLALG